MLDLVVSKEHTQICEGGEACNHGDTAVGHGDVHVYLFPPLHVRGVHSDSFREVACGHGDVTVGLSDARVLKETTQR